MAVKHLLVSDHSKQEMHQTNFHRCELHYKPSGVEVKNGWHYTSTPNMSSWHGA